MKKRIIALILAVVTVLLSVSSVSALDITKAIDAANTLYAFGLFNGTGKDIYGNPTFDLNRAATRQEAITMLVRLLGKEEEALAGTWELPFTDVADWAVPYVGYAYANGLTSGIGSDTFGADDPVTAAQYITFALRSLGYSSETDFTWSSPWYFAYYIGLCEHGEYRDANNTAFKRGDVAIVSLNVLGKPHKETGVSIIERLYDDILKTEESAISFSAMVNEICSARRNLFNEVVDYSAIRNSAVEDPALSRLLSDSEIKLLRTSRSAKSVTYEQAMADVDVYFRSFEYAYGAYYYFGKDFFDSIKAKVIADLKGRTTVTASELDGILRKHMSVVKDCHLRRGSFDKYEYYYCEGQSFFKEGGKYYKLIDGEKWQYVSCDSEHVSMEPHLTKNGAIVYSPVWFYLNAEAEQTSEITLRRNGRKITETVSWIKNKAYSESNKGVDHKLLIENGIAYVSVRSFGAAQSQYAGFLNSAAKVKNAKAIIFDMRSCAGGTDRYGRQWVTNFTGETPYPRLKIVTRNTALTGSAKKGEERISMGGNKGSMISNDIPVIVLTDDLCSSAAEFTIQNLKAMNNTITVGGPSRGCSFCCGSLPTFYLPNSGVSYTFGTTMYWFDNNENTDDIGIKPDIWCDPASALNASLLLLVREGIMDAETAWAITEGTN